VILKSGRKQKGDSHLFRTVLRCYKLLEIERKRFVRYQESLFVFLTEDGIPWHNNTAERAIRSFAIQRDVSKSPFQDTTTHHYLVLLGIRQTCRFQGKSFFKFLFSGETDLEQFEAHKRKR
jgi:Transposase IS66 family